jgi:hypothetical protein
MGTGKYRLGQIPIGLLIECVPEQFPMERSPSEVLPFDNGYQMGLPNL